MLVAVIAPFFTSFLVRTLSWKLLLGDNGFIVDAGATRCPFARTASGCWRRRSR